MYDNGNPKEWLYQSETGQLKSRVQKSVTIPGSQGIKAYYKSENLGRNFGGIST